MAATPETVAKKAAQELVITRTFEAPRVLVWKAWTEREHLLHWSCPSGFITLFSESNLENGGAWRTGMRSPEGQEYVMRGEYREIAPPERLVFTHGWERDELHDGHETLVSVHLEENGGRTKMTFTQSNLATASSRDGHAEGWSGAFDNLDNYLHQQQNTKG